MKVSLILPSYGRPQLTERAIRSVFAQEFAAARGDARPTAEVFFFGDGCPVYQAIITSDWFQQGVAHSASWLEVHTRNHEVRDGTPTRIINEALAAARGEFVLFMANDDRLAPSHFANYYDFAKAQEADLTHTNSTIEMGGDCVGRLAGTLAPPRFSIRGTALQYGCVGHAEICVRTTVAQAVPPHHRGYGHDWDFIRAVVASSRPDRVRKSPGPPTYFVNMDPQREHVYQNGTL